MGKRIKSSIRNKEELPFIVLIGASAGGLEALQDLLTNFGPIPDNLAIIIAQHVSPTHKSMLAGLLRRITSMDVVDATTGEHIEANKIYITPPDKDIVIQDGKIVLLAPKNVSGPKPSIDVLFKSAVNTSVDRIIGIILSGTGTDGATGVVALKNAGGFILAQSPASAKYDGMPLAAIETDHVDLILSPEKMGSVIIDFLNHPQKVRQHVNDELEKDSDYDNVLKLLSRHCGTDFSNYKITTINRRIQKRMNMIHIQKIDEYVKYLKANPSELENLYQSVLIGVTSFFRDSESFEELEKVIHKIVQLKEQKESIRIWIPGCSSGEEAYSIAILLSKTLSKVKNKLTFQIFATDIDNKALEKARDGIYSFEAVKELPDKIVKEFFNKDGEVYEIIKSIRSMVLFSKHDLTTNPPFLNLDLISCRNLLIYFDTTLQNKTIPLFHYALNKTGYLFLGRSETVGPFSNLFGTVDSVHKIFSRKNTTNSNPLKFSSYQASKQVIPKSKHKRSNRDVSISEIVKETLYKTFDHPYVIIDSAYDIKEVCGDVRLFMGLSEGLVQNNLIKMVNPELQIEVRSVLMQAIKNREIVKSNIRKFELFERFYYVRITIKPLIYSNDNDDLFIVIFEKLDIEPFLNKGVENRTLGTNLNLEELELELKTTREQLQSYIEEIETSNEELQSLNEELQSTNEEFQSTNEELETTNEELQSTNEEVQIAYTELKNVYAELEIKDSLLEDRERNLQALLNNRLQAFILIDDRYTIIAQNELAEELAHKLGQSIKMAGKSFFDFCSAIHLEKLIEDIRTAFTGKEVSGEIEETDVEANKLWLQYHITPVLDRHHRVRLVSVGMLDITLKKFNQQLMYASEQKYRAAFQNSMLGFFVTNPDGRIIDANIAACEMFGYTVDEFRALGRGGIIDPNTPNLQEILKERLEKGKVTGELICVRKNGQRFQVEFTSALFENDEGELNSTTIMHDISNRKEREHHLKLLESVLTNTQDAVLITEAEPLDEPGPKIIFVNDAFTKMTGYTPDEVIGKNPRILQGPKSDPKLLREFGEKLRKWETCELETINYKKNGEEFWINIKATPVANESGWYTHWFAIERDVTERKNREIYRKLINDINQHMNASTMLKESLQSVLELFSPVLDFDLCEIWTVNLDKKIINIVAKYANNPDADQFYEMTKDDIVMKHGQGLPGTIWKKKERVSWNKIGNRKLYLRNKAAKDVGLNSFLGYPLIHNNKVVAILLFGLKDEFVQVDKFDSIIHPISDQLGAEIRRKQLDEEIEMIFNFAPDIICVAGMDGYFKKVNPAMSQMLGFTENELLSQPITTFVHPDDKNITGEEIKGIRKGEGRSFFENRYVTKDGDTIWLSWTTTILYEEGLIYSVAKNITDKKEAYQRLNKLHDELESRAKALADSNAELEQFAYVASHDLQEPLRMVTSFLTQIEKKYNDLLDDKGRQYIHFAVDGAQRMRSIILDLLEYSRVGRAETEYTDFNLGEIVNEIIHLHKAQLSETNGKISYSKLPDLHAIRVPIRQLMQNLIGNALKFRAKDRPPEIQITAKELKSHWEISVKDNGIGISADHSDRIFIIFQRLHTKQEYEGSGMGLAICKKIVEKHGGKIWVESTPGNGSDFRFTIKK